PHTSHYQQSLENPSVTAKQPVNAVKGMMPENSPHTKGKPGNGKGPTKGTATNG
ncbi:hypothetical protein BGX29_003683, partial [Mortierella sp. GBA35]